MCGQWLGTTEAAGGPVVEKAPVLRTTRLSMSVSGPGGGGGAALLHPHDKPTSWAIQEGKQKVREVNLQKSLKGEAPFPSLVGICV